MKFVVFWCAIGFSMAACGVLEKSVTYPCANVLMLQDGKKLVKFKTGSRRDITDILFEAEILNFEGSCKYEKRARKWETQIDLIVRFLVRRDNATKSEATEFKYFVAITSPKGRMEGKSIFPVIGTFKEKRSILVYEDSIDLRIPLDNPTEGATLKVLLGFQLSPEELQYNRDKGKN
ncbi:MAG: hypothetical protein VYB39_04595 [Pseudomonadota bacterium]|nr:hypothetical protein [Pseudomonadota bacterium]